MIKTSAITAAALFALAPCASVASASYFDQPSYTDVFSFLDTELGANPMGLAYDGDTYHAVSGGSSDGVRYARFDSDGLAIDSYQTNIDYRSITASPEGDIFIRRFATNRLRLQTSPGVYTTVLTLNDAFINPNAQILMNPAGDRVHSFNDGALFTWDADTGAFIEGIVFDGWGDLNGEADDIQRDRFAIADDGTFLTYSNGTLSAWDNAGERIGTTTLLQGGSGTASHYSLSYTNGLVFVADSASGTWRGYAIPTPGLPAMLICTGLIAARRRR